MTLFRSPPSTKRGRRRAYAGPAQAVSAAIKLPFLFLGTLAISFPGFFVIRCFSAPVSGAQVLAVVLGALSLSASSLAAVVPITFFLFTGANYYF